MNVLNVLVIRYSITAVNSVASIVKSVCINKTILVKNATICVKDVLKLMFVKNVLKIPFLIKTDV